MQTHRHSFCPRFELAGCELAAHQKAIWPYRRRVEPQLISPTEIQDTGTVYWAETTWWLLTRAGSCPASLECMRRAHASIWKRTKLRSVSQMIPSTFIAPDNGGCPSLNKGCEFLSAAGSLEAIWCGASVTWGRTCRTGLGVVSLIPPQICSENFGKCYRLE